MLSDDAGTVFAGRYGDGVTASRVAAQVTIDPAGLAVKPAMGAAFVWPFEDLRVSDPLRARSLDAVITAREAEPASLYIEDAQLLAALVKRAPQLGLGNGRWRDARAGLAVGALALASYACLWIFDVSPSKGVAQLMPAKARAVLGDSVIRTMPAQQRCVGSPDAHAALERLTRRLMPKGPISADNIIVLDWKLLNAFAVPGNRIVLTRGLIEQAKGPDELAAVIGHEAGHSIELHPEASLVRSVGFWALVQMVFTGTPGAVGNIGVVLAQLGYTRSAERQADEHALRLMREAHISPKAMADFFRRMEKRIPTPTTGDSRVVSDILSSHPSNPERIARIESEPAYETTPALSDADWAALKKICGAPPPVPASRPTTPPANSKPTPEAAGKQPGGGESHATAAASGDDQRAGAAKIEAMQTETNRPAPQGSETRPSAKSDAERTDVAKTEAGAPPVPAPKSDAPRTESPKTDLPKADAPARQAAATPPPSTPDARIAEASRRIAADKNDVAAYIERGQALAAKHETAAAIEDFSRALALKPADASTLFWRAAMYAQRGQADQALADYTEVIRLQPKNFAAYNNRGSLYRAQKKLDLALKDYSTAIAVDSKQAIALTNRALVYREQNNLDAAMVDLNAAVTANPSYANAYVRRGETLELKSQRTAAVADYRTVLRFPEPPTVTSEPHKTARARLTALGEKF